MREKAGCYRAVVDRVIRGACFNDDAAFEEEGIGVLVAGLVRCIDRRDARVGGGGGWSDEGFGHADGAVDVVETAGLSAEVVGAVVGFDVLVVVAAGQDYVAVGGYLVGILVVGEVIGTKDVVAVRKNHVAGGGVDVVMLGLGEIALEYGGFLRLGGGQNEGVGNFGEVDWSLVGGTLRALIWYVGGRGFLCRYGLRL